MYTYIYMYISTVFFKQTAKPGSLAVDSIHVTRVPTFLDYITEGCELTVTGREKKGNKTVEIWRCACYRQEGKTQEQRIKRSKKKNGSFKSKLATQFTINYY